jgi:hypothetical protein
MNSQTSLNDSNQSEAMTDKSEATASEHTTMFDNSEAKSARVPEKPLINDLAPSQPTPPRSEEAPRLVTRKDRVNPTTGPSNRTERSQSRKIISSTGTRVNKGDTKTASTTSKAKVLRDLDLPIKLAVGAALATGNYYTRINVGLSATSSKGLGDVTDIDVLGLKYDPAFNLEAIAVSCKSGSAKSLSAAKEVFYLRGVLDYVRARTGVAAFLNKPVSPHLRDLGRRLNVLLLSGDEIESWRRTLTNGLPDPGYFKESAFEQYLTIWANNAVLTDLRTYLRSDYWFHLDFRNLQNVIGHLRKLSAKLGPRRDWLDIVVLDSAAHLSLTLFDLCHEIRMTGLTSIVDTTSAYLFGGTVSFKARKDLYARVQQLLASTGVLGAAGPTLPPLEPMYTQALTELAIRFIERPHAAVVIPQVFQDSIWRRLGAPGMPSNDDKNSLSAEKLAQDVLDFLDVATGANWKIRI